MWVGLCPVEVFPSPKSHAHAVGLPVEVPVNWTVSGAGPEVVFVVKAARDTGANFWTRPENSTT